MADEWTHEGAQPITVRARSHGGFVTYRVDEARMHHSMFDAHPIHGTSSPVSSATLQLRNANDHALTGAAPDPLSRPDNWPPADGLGMEVDVGDGRPSGWRRQLTGIVTGTSGALSSPVVEVEVADDMRSLTRLLNSNDPNRSDAIRQPLPPHPDGDGTSRYVRLTTAFLVDRAARTGGYYATAVPRWGYSRLVVPMMGSALPEVGEVVTCRNVLPDSNEYPFRILTPWGLGLRRFEANYKCSSTIGSTFEVVVDLAPRVAGADPAEPVQVRVNGTDGTWWALVYSHATDTITAQYGTSAGAAGSVKVTLPRSGADRVAMRVTPTTVALHRDIDTYATTTTLTENHSGWSATTVRVRAQDAGVGGIEVASNPPAWSTVSLPRTAYVLMTPAMALHNGWNVCPHTFDKTPFDVLTETAEAELGGWWVRNGVLTWAGGGALESQPIAATVTSAVDLVDAQWRTSIGNRAESVRIEWQQPRERASKDPRVEVWRGGDSSLENGDLWETWATPPAEEDWIGVDTTLHKVGASSTPAQMRVGSIYAIESGETDDYEYSSWDTLTQAVVERVTQRAYKWTVSPLAATGRIVNLRWPDNLAAGERTFRRSWEGEDGLILRGTCLVTWAEQTTPARSTGATNTSRSEYVHTPGRYVQREDHLQAVEDLLVAELATGYPAVTAKIRAHPDITVGSLIDVEDQARTGLTVTLLVQQSDPTWRPGDAEMTVSGRVTAWEIDNTIRDEAAPIPHWLQLQAGHGSTGIGGSYGD